MSLSTDRSRGEVAASISNSVVRVVNEYTGRGPTKARTSIDDDLIVCVLQDTLTKGERSLVANGDAQLVLDVRRTYQRAMREDLVRAVEQATGRTVMAFMSDNHIDPDYAAETFVLEPLGTGPSPPV